MGGEERGRGGQMFTVPAESLADTMKVRSAWSRVTKARERGSQACSGTSQQAGKPSDKGRIGW